VTLLDLGKVYLRGFVPEGEIGRVRVGQPARVHLDSNPEQAIEALVSRTSRPLWRTLDSRLLSSDLRTNFTDEVVGGPHEVNGRRSHNMP